MLAYLYCAAYIRIQCTSHHHPVNRGALHLTMMGRECSWLDPSYQRHIAFACTGCYQLHPHHRLRHYFHRLIAGTNLPTPKGLITWLAKADCTYTTFAQLHNWIQRHQKKMNPGCRVQDQLNTSEPIAPYIIGREFNLRKLPGRQWKSNPQPSKQLRPMTIKISSSTETATTAYINSEL